jgi:cysteine synthase A
VVTSEKPLATILDRIGNTPMVELRSIVPDNGARILLKLESENPTGSIKDRQALAMVEAAEQSGRLKKGGTIVEYTGGSTGIALAMIGAVKGYKVEIITSDAFAKEKRDNMEAFGAHLTIIKSVDGGMDEALTRNMVKKAAEIAEETGGYFTDQLANSDQIAAYWKMGEEIWNQTEGKIDAFVQFTGTCGSSRGNAEYLKKKKSDIHITVVEPSESAVLSGHPTGVHKIEGTGAGYVVPLWDPSLFDDIATVSTEDCMEMSRRMAKEEGLFAGTSTGGNVVTALKVAEKLGPDATVVTLMCDSGVKYLSTALYKRP